MTTSLRTAAVLGGATLLIAASASVASAASASAPPPVSGCPAAAETLRTADFAEFYRVPQAVDSAGNGNGIVCGIRINDRAAEQLFGTTTCLSHLGCYLFSDDALTPRH